MSQFFERHPQQKGMKWKQQCLSNNHHLHPRKLTWNTIMKVCKINLLSIENLWGHFCWRRLGVAIDMSRKIPYTYTYKLKQEEKKQE